MQYHEFSKMEKNMDKFAHALKEVKFISNTLKAWDTNKQDVTEDDMQVISNLLAGALTKLDCVKSEL